MAIASTQQPIFGYNSLQLARLYYSTPLKLWNQRILSLTLSFFRKLNRTAATEATAVVNRE